MKSKQAFTERVIGIDLLAAGLLFFLGETIRMELDSIFLVCSQNNNVLCWWHELQLSSTQTEMSLGP